MNSNNEIMKRWIEHRTTDTGVYVEDSADAIPLSVDDFLNWADTQTYINIYLFLVKNVYLRIYKIDVNLKFEIEFNTRKLIELNNLKILSSSYTVENNQSYRPEEIVFKFYRFDPLGQRRINKMTLHEILNAWCNPERRKYYTLSAVKNKQRYNKTIKQWEKAELYMFESKLSRTFNNLIELETLTKPINKHSDVKSGELVIITITNIYKNLTKAEQSELIMDSDTIEQVVGENLKMYDDFGYYMINILSVKITNISISNTHAITQLLLSVHAEIISVDDYYNTIGYYKTAYNNICSGKFNGGDLTSLAKELEIEDISSYSRKELCELIAENIDNWRYSS